ncbi:MAG: hypothetical protein L6367_15940 [Cellulomonas sp.]|nr:hypothetical protein [Cellulomonas sp.]
MTSVAKIVAAMRANPRSIRYDDLAKVCDNDRGQAKAYQVRQVLAAIEKLEGME